MFLFKRPSHIYRKYDWATYVPLIVASICMIDPTRKKMWSIFLLISTMVDEIVFRYLFFKIEKRHLNGCLASAFLYSCYSYYLSFSISAMITYLVVGFFFALASRKFSLAELILFRYMINIYCLGTQN